MGERHAFRAKWHDYNDGIYFVTICSHEKKHIFGKIANGTMHMNELGEVVANCLKDIAFHNSDIEILNSVVMPNHVHMIISITSPPSAALVRARYIAPLPAPTNPAANSASVSPNLGCLKPPMHGGPIDDFHHNSRLAQVVGGCNEGISPAYAGAMYRTPTTNLATIVS